MIICEFNSHWWQFLPSAMKLRQGNIFTSVCPEFCLQGRVSASVHAGIHPPDRHPPGQTSPWADTPSGQTPPGQTTPWADTPSPWADTPLGRHHPLGRHLPGQTSPGRHPPWPLQWTVHTLLECFLVFFAETF